jgi:hypothetical protein
MNVKCIQLTVLVPQKIHWESELLTVLREERLVKQMVREGRQLVSWGISRQEENETEVILNYE